MVDEVWIAPDGVAVVTLAGELDQFTVPALRDQLTGLLRAGRVDVVVDLSAVTFIDSTGLGVLVGASKRAEDDGGALRLVVRQDWLMRVLRTSSLTEVFAIHGTLDEALARDEPAT